MHIKKTDYIDISKKFSQLNLNVPSEIALLPNNFDTAVSPEEFLYESSTSTFKKLMKQKGLPESQLEKNGRSTRQIILQSDDWVAPVIYLSDEAVRTGIITIILNLISTYLYDVWKVKPKDSKVKIKLVTEKIHNNKKIKKRTYKLISFEGSMDELEEFKEQINEIIES